MAQLPHFSLQIVTPPTVEAVSLDEAKNELRIDQVDDDGWLAGAIRSAREKCEAESGGRSTTATQYRMTLDRFPLLPNSQYAPGFPSSMQPIVNNLWPFDPSAWAIILPRSPLISVDSLQYYDLTGTLQTMDPATYIIDSDSEPPRLTTAQASYWPACQYRPGAVRITFTAGYATASAVPEAMKDAMRFWISQRYDNRSAGDMDVEKATMTLRYILGPVAVAAAW